MKNGGTTGTTNHGFYASEIKYGGRTFRMKRDRKFDNEWKVVEIAENIHGELDEKPPRWFDTKREAIAWIRRDGR